MHVQWSNVRDNGEHYADVSGNPTYTISGGNCYFCEDYDKQIGLLLEHDDKTYDITNNYLIDNTKKLFVICGSCSVILGINSNRRGEKYYRHYQHTMYDDGDYAMLYYDMEEEKPDNLNEMFWSELSAKQLSYVLDEVFSDIKGRESKIVTNYKELVHQLGEHINIPGELLKIILTKSDEYYLYTCYHKMLLNS